MSPKKDAPVAVAPWKVDAVQLDPGGTRICWRPWPPPGTDRPPVRLLASDRGPFTRFLRLARFTAEAPELSDEVLELAREFGPLDLCAEHGFPSSHHRSWTLLDPATELSDAIEVPEECLPERYDPPRRPRVRRSTGAKKTPAGIQFRKPWDLWYAEPVARWHGLAVQARAITETAALLRANKISISQANWELIEPISGVGLTRLAAGAAKPSFANRLDPEDRAHFQQSHAQRLAEQRAALAETVQQSWLARGGVITHLDWSDATPRVSLGAGDLFSYLALQLTLNVLARKGIAFCASCAKDFEPDRMSGIYCSDLCRLDGEAEGAKRRRDKLRADPERYEPKSQKTKATPPSVAQATTQGPEGPEGP